MVELLKELISVKWLDKILNRWNDSLLLKILFIVLLLVCSYVSTVVTVKNKFTELDQSIDTKLEEKLIKYYDIGWRSNNKILQSMYIALEECGKSKCFVSLIKIDGYNQKERTSEIEFIAVVGKHDTKNITNLLANANHNSVYDVKHKINQGCYNSLLRQEGFSYIEDNRDLGEHCSTEKTLLTLLRKKIDKISYKVVAQDNSDRSFIILMTGIAGAEFDCQTCVKEISILSLEIASLLYPFNVSG